MIDSLLLEKLRAIKCLICDVDGVLTDGSLFMDNFGNSLKAFNVHDGMGLKLLMNAGIKVVVITTSDLGVIDHRMKQLGIKLYYKGQREKETAFEDIKKNFQFEDKDFAYIGDDLPDLSIIRRVGLGIAVANAVPEVKEFSDLVTKVSGGNGAVREICDLLLKSQDKFDIALSRYLNEEQCI